MPDGLTGAPTEVWRPTVGVPVPGINTVLRCDVLEMLLVTAELEVASTAMTA
jgi:hypothetical protein